MSLFDWFDNLRKPEPEIKPQQEREIADGLWTKCPNCGEVAYTKDLQVNNMVCLECEHHMSVMSDERIAQLIDPQTWQPLNDHLLPTDPLQFYDRKSYSDRIKDLHSKTSLTDAVQTGTGLIDGLPLALGVMDFRFMGGSMGSDFLKLSNQSNKDIFYELCLSNKLFRRILVLIQLLLSPSLLSTYYRHFFERF